jgi:hypothetical protein
MADIGPFDPNAKPSEVFEPIPAGKYVALISESDVKPTKNNTGDLLNLKWVILEGPYERRVVFDRINMRNQNPQAQEIGQRQLASLRQATSVNSPRDSAEFHNIACIINVKVRPAGPDKNGVHREAQNEIKGYEKLGAAQPAATVQQQSPPAYTNQPVRPGGNGAATTMPAAPARAPWKR